VRNGEVEGGAKDCGHGDGGLFSLVCIKGKSIFEQHKNKRQNSSFNNRFHS